tara:strand:- start:353 stop:712 length:360 start_codon:yes stop_codon:yes gene_type:complete
MATITLTIGGSLNSSLCIRDQAYTCSLASSGGFKSNDGNIVDLGAVTAIDNSTNTITVDVGSTVIGTNALNNKMLLFSKDNIVNTSGLTGYYAEVKMSNTSIIKSELYAVNSEVVQSSK